MVRVPSKLHAVFTVSLNGVAISHEKVNGAVACVQDFVQNPLITQTNLLSATGIRMFSTSVTAADALRHSSEFDPWGAIGIEVGSVIADLRSCLKKVVLRRKAFKDTRERWFRVETVASSAASSSTVRISDVVEVENVEYVKEQDKRGLHCCSRSLSSPGKSEKRQVPVSPVAGKKTIF